MNTCNTRSVPSLQQYIDCNSTLCVGVNLEGDRSTVLVLVACCLMLSNNLMFYTRLYLLHSRKEKERGKKARSSSCFLLFSHCLFV